MTARETSGPARIWTSGNKDIAKYHLLKAFFKLLSSGVIVKYCTISFSIVKLHLLELLFNTIFWSYCQIPSPRIIVKYHRLESIGSLNNSLLLGLAADLPAGHIGSFHV
jgi:hypothetical protein